MSTEAIKPLAGQETSNLKPRNEQVPAKRLISQAVDSVVSHTGPELRADQAERQMEVLIQNLGANGDRALDAIGGLNEDTVRSLLSDD